MEVGGTCDWVMLLDFWRECVIMATRFCWLLGDMFDMEVDKHSNRVKPVTS